MTVLLDNEPVSLTLKPMLSAGEFERRRRMGEAKAGRILAGFLGGDLSHPFHIEKHFFCEGW